jgi:hypothetical protein
MIQIIGITQVVGAIFIAVWFYGIARINAKNGLNWIFIGLTAYFLPSIVFVIFCIVIPSTELLIDDAYVIGCVVGLGIAVAVFVQRKFLPQRKTLRVEMMVLLRLISDYLREYREEIVKTVIWFVIVTVIPYVGYVFGYALIICYAIPTLLVGGYPGWRYGWTTIETEHSHNIWTRSGGRLKKAIAACAAGIALILLSDIWNKLIWHIEYK